MKTMQMQSVETSAGSAICAAPSRMPVCRSLPSIEIAIDIFDGDGGVVHQDADGQRQAAQRHDVDGFAERAQDADGAEDRKRNRDRDDQRAAPAPQKEQDHDGGKAGGDDGFADHSVDGGAHEQRLIGDRLDLQRGRKRGGDFGQHVAHFLDDVERGGVADFQDAEQGAALPVAADDVGLRREAVAHVRHVVHVDGGVAGGLDRKIVEFLDRLRTGVETDVIFELADFRGAGGQDQVLGVDRR